ncbi:MAG: hypothetical protein ABIN01_20895 [Ferruginibacter sp.]
MTKFILLCVFMPFMVIAQTKNVMNVTRFFPKIDKVQEFEKALTAHAQKYHTGDWKWRVFEIETGPDAGGYQVIEGPNSWDQFDKRGNLGQEHTNDYNKTVAIHLTQKYSSMYSVFIDSLSSVALTDYSDKISITHVFPKPGWASDIRSLLAKYRKVWQAGGESVAVYTSSSSGPTQFALVTRYKQGLKEKEDNFRKPFKDRYEALFGVDSYMGALESIRTHAESAWSEMLSLRADLGSK